MNTARTWLLSLLLVLPLSGAIAAANEAPVEGRDYVRVDAGTWQPADGRIEVVEIFSYGCHVCDQFHPMIETWRRRLPQDVRFHYVPAAYRAQDPFATGFFAAEALGALDQVHEATFDGLHRNGWLARNATADEIAGYYAQLGLDRDALAAAMASDETRQKLNAAHEFLRRSGAQGTPTVIINGKYRVQGRSLREVLQISDRLIAQERAEAGR